MIDLSLNSQLNKLTTVPANAKSLREFCTTLGVKYNPNNCIKIKNFTSGINANLCILIFSEKGIIIAGITSRRVHYEEPNPDYNPTEATIDTVSNLLNTNSDNTMYNYNDSDVSSPTRDVDYVEHPFTGSNYLLPIKSISAMKLVRPTHFRHYLVIVADGSQCHFSMSKITLMFNLRLKHMASDFASQYRIPFLKDTKNRN